MKSKKEHLQCFQLDADPGDVQKCVKEGHRVGLILRGVTGSGKTTLANQFFDVSNEKHALISTDDTYCSQITKQVRNATENDMALIIVDAENVERSVIKTLTGVLIQASYECYVMEPTTFWKYQADECRKYSQRDEDVEEIERKIDVIRKSRITWNHIFTGSVIVSNFHHNDTSTSVSTPISTQSTSFSTSPTQLFSLVPAPKMTCMKTVETNVSMACIIYELAGHKSREKGSGYSLVREEHFNAKETKSSKTPPSQSTQTEDVVRLNDEQVLFRTQQKLLMGTQEEREFSLLKSVLPDVDLLVLKHYHQVLGFNKVFGMFDGFECVQPNLNLPDDDREIRDEISYLEGNTISNRHVEDEVEMRRSERARLEFNEDIFIPDETENDEEIARALQDAEGNIQQIQTDDILARLRQCFPKTDDSLIKFALEANISFELTRNCLIETFNEKEATNFPKTIPNSYSTKAAANCKVTRKPEKSANERKNHFLNATSSRIHQSLTEVQREALNARASLENDRIYEKSHNPSAAPQFHRSVMMDRLIRRREILAKQVNDIDKKIRAAHQNPYFLDLHYMSVNGAMNLVEEALEAARYYNKYVRRPERTLTVVTGSGNNSKDGAKIKPSIISLLVESKITYRMVNDGCLVIKL